MSTPRRWSLARYLRYRRLYKFIFGLVVLAVLVTLSVLDHRGTFVFTGGDWQRYHQQWFDVVRVIDGDTLVIDAPDGERPDTHVRLWGIDTPELAHPELGREAEPFAEAARDFARERLRGRRVRLRLAYHRMRGNFGRLLAYVELPDGTVLNEELLLAGLARADPRFGHDDLTRYQMLESQARRDHVGLWADKVGR